MAKLRLASLDKVEENFAVLELIPDTHAWAKDKSGHFIYANRLLFERLGFSSMQGLLGKTDFDIASTNMAESYLKDDAAVLNGSVVTDRLELMRGKDESMEWFLTSKWPLYNLKEQIIGTLGISRHLNREERRHLPFRELRAPIAYIEQHFAGQISVKAIADACNISVSALERRFKKHLHKTPHQYINEFRLENARKLLIETDKSIGTIAAETGFSDHSHFTRAFVTRYAQTPKALRSSESA